MIALRPITLEDFDTVLCWSKDELFCRRNDWPYPRSEQDVRDWWTHCVTMPPNNVERLAITLVGQMISYVDYLFEDGQIELGIASRSDSSLFCHDLGVLLPNKRLTACPTYPACSKA